MLEPDDPVERLCLFAVEPVLRLARVVPLDAAAARVWPLLEPELRDEPLAVLPAPFRAVVAGLRELLRPLLALLLAVFRLVCLRGLLVVATRSPFPGLITRYPRLERITVCNVARARPPDAVSVRDAGAAADGLSACRPAGASC